MGRSVQANTVYDDLTNVKGELVRTYGIRDILNRSVITKKSRVIHINHLEDDTVDIPKLVAYLDAIGYNGGIDYNEKKQDVIVGVAGKSKIQIRFILQKLSGGGRQQVPTPVQEKGTTVIFNRALRDNVKFPTKESIKEDKKTWDELLEVFGDWKDRLPLWTHTYWQQQKQFLKKYQGAEWDVFVYDGDDFVTFFRKNLPRITRDPETNKPVGDYTTWNPSDIYAARNLKEIQKNIKDKIPTEPQHIAQLNNYLANLMNNKELVGISLKMINKEDPAHIKLLNDNDHYTLTEVTKFKFKDIEYKLDNIFAFKTDTGGKDIQSTTVGLGKGKGRYEINIKRAGDNIIWGTSIKATPAAQGGNAPVGMVLNHLGTGYDNKASAMPKNGKDFNTNKAKFKKMWDNVKGKMNNPPKWEDFQDKIIVLYAKDDRSAKVKLLQLNFWSDVLNALNSKKDDGKNSKSEWWKDLLYLGLKVGKQGQFAPHAKIS
tara:strand:+ start:93 stop:1550 length:1458 start_codon:yes stop_codon:yes gene_type:complete